MHTIALLPRYLHRTAIAAGLALAASPVTAQLVLEEIIVTAQKRESSLQDIAATVNVVGGETIDDFLAFDFADIEALTAGVSLISPNARNATISIRGVSIDPESGADGTVDVYWNGVQVNPNIAFSEMYDMERIEILRGPQGSLQGRSSPGGAILTLTRGASTDEADGYAQVTLSNNDGANLQFAYGAPLVEDVFGLRVAGVYDMNDNRGVDNAVTGDDGEKEAYSARLSGLWNITDDLSASFAYQYLQRDTDDPFAVSGTDSLGQRPTLDAQDEIALGSSTNVSDFEYDIVHLTLDWSFGNHDLKSITGYSDQTREYLQDNDVANYVTNPLALTTQNSVTEQEIFIQELHLSSSGNAFWDYMVGVYYQDSDVTADFVVNTTTTLAPSTPVLGAYQFTLATRSFIPVESEQKSIFTFNTFNLSETVQLDIGLRYTDYERFRAAEVAFDHLPYLPAPASLPPGVPAEVVLSGLVDRVTAALPISGINADNQNTEEDQWTGSITLRWDATEDMSYYAGIYTGYRSSGISIVPSPNVQFLPNGQDDILHDAEDSLAYEIGFKGNFLDGRASLNGALYYQEYDGYLGFVRGVEVLNDQGLPVVLPGGLIFNGDAITYGLELDGRILISDNWSAGGAFAWNKGEWDGAEQPCNIREPGEIIGRCDLDGERIGGEPEWSLSLYSEYTMPLSGGSEAYVRGLYKYTDERGNISASAGIGDVVDEFDAYAIVDLFVGWRSADEKWDVNVFGKNLFDEDKVIFQNGPDQYDQQFSGGSYTQTNILQAQQIGVSGRFNF